MIPRTEEQIRDRAYAIWEADGRPEGHEMEHWQQAERELAEEADLDVSEEQSDVDLPPVVSGTPIH